MSILAPIMGPVNLKRVGKLACPARDGAKMLRPYGTFVLNH